MLGAEFKGMVRRSRWFCSERGCAAAACKDLPASWTVFDEIYQMTKLRARPGPWPALARQASQRQDARPLFRSPGASRWAGRVFYTSLGHREDMWDGRSRDAGPEERARGVQGLPDARPRGHPSGRSVSRRVMPREAPVKGNGAIRVGSRADSVTDCARSPTRLRWKPTGPSRAGASRWLGVAHLSSDSENDRRPNATRPGTADCNGIDMATGLILVLALLRVLEPRNAIGRGTAWRRCVPAGIRAGS
jgi:hypothetical protein